MEGLILVDIQNDFLPGGALAVTGGDEVIPVANTVGRSFDLVVATADWHPRGHGSFASAHSGKGVGEVIELSGLPQVLWPDHCVQGTWGAEFAQSFDTRRVDRVIHKGVSPDIDSYSGFYDNGHRQATGLHEYLLSREVDAVYILGLATDYCVKFTALDGVALGYHTYLIVDGCRGVEVNPGDVDRAVREMADAGVVITSSDKVLQRRG